MVAFKNFGDETDINSPAEIGTTPIFYRGKIFDFQGYRFQLPFLTILATKLTLLYQLNRLKCFFNRLKIPCRDWDHTYFLTVGKLWIFKDIVSYGCFGYNISS